MLNFQQGENMIRKYKLNNSCTTYVVYQKKKRTSQNPNRNSLIGEKIYSQYLGWGTIVSADRDLCTIQYRETKIQCYQNCALHLIEKTKELTGGKS